MIINDNTERKPVEFQELEIGDLFEWDGRVCIRITVKDDDYNACCLTNHTFIDFGPTIKVVKRNGYLVLT